MEADGKADGGTKRCAVDELGAQLQGEGRPLPHQPEKKRRRVAQGI